MMLPSHAADSPDVRNNPICKACCPPPFLVAHLDKAPVILCSTLSVQTLFGFHLSCLHASTQHQLYHVEPSLCVCAKQAHLDASSAQRESQSGLPLTPGVPKCSSSTTSLSCSCATFALVGACAAAPMRPSSSLVALSALMGNNTGDSLLFADSRNC